MDFQERSFPGDRIRPRPEFNFFSEEGLLLVATPWGPRAGAKNTNKIISDFVITHFRDPDATSPFPRIPALSEIANSIRVGALLANDSLMKTENKDEYRSGVELFAAMKKDREVSWIQIGQPHVVLLRKGRSPLMLSANIDLSMELAESRTEVQDPLPSDCLGLQAIPPLFLNSFRVQDGDKLLLLSYSWPPEKIYLVPEAKWDIEGFTEVLVKNNGQEPFWIGLWSF
jgi:hypothetical protein